MKLQKAISAILFESWDPIGVNSDVNAHSEYDQYALRIAGMLKSGCTESQIVQYLDSVVLELGLTSNIGTASLVAKKLRALILDQYPF